MRWPAPGYDTRENRWDLPSVCSRLSICHHKCCVSLQSCWVTTREVFPATFVSLLVLLHGIRRLTFYGNILCILKERVLPLTNQVWEHWGLWQVQYLHEYGNSDVLIMVEECRSLCRKDIPGPNQAWWLLLNWPQSHIGYFIQADLAHLAKYFPINVWKIFSQIGSNSTCNLTGWQDR